MRAQVIRFSMLIVDDNPSERKQVKGRIESVFDGRSFSIDTACDGQEGLEYCLKKAYTFYILDYKMPKMNGVELSNKLLAMRPEAHVILYSASSKDEIGPFNDRIHFIRKDVRQLVEHLQITVGSI